MSNQHWQFLTMSYRYSFKILHFVFAGTSGLIIACSKEPMSVYQPPEIEYKFNVPPGKLPWPHQSPELTQQEYEASIDNIWIIQNYGENICTLEPRTNSMHDALDIVVDANAKIYAVDRGYVKSTSPINEFGGTITIKKNIDSKEWIEWSYTHVWNYQVQPGQPIVQGQYIANEKFDGLPHIHLQVLKAGGGWNLMDGFADLMFPDDFFEYRDTDPPIIDQIYFFKNNSDERVFPNHENKLVVSGEVDIVVGMREVGRYAHSKSIGEEPFGDRLAVTGAKYIIEGNGINPYEVLALDFRTMNLGDPTTGSSASPDIIYKWYYLISDNPSWNNRLSYYILSNFDGPRKDHFSGSIDPSNSWKTNKLDGAGYPLFPNGKYTLTTVAWDAKGNQASVSIPVWVENP